MREFNLVDSYMGGYSVPGRLPATMRWRREGHDPALPTFWSHEKIFEAPAGGVEQYALVLESKAILPQLYAALPAVVDRFTLVFTHDSALLATRPDKCRFIPANGVWIGGEYGGGQVALSPKTKLVSMLSSTKLYCPLHKFRLELALELRNVQGIDVTIGGHGKSSGGGWRPVSETLTDYLYSIVVENYVDDAFFTEKILNCFATGTVPIYFGARKIGDYFDPNGIIPFTSRDDLVGVLRTLSADDYLRRRDAIIDNFNRVKDYMMPEDYICRHYLGG